MSAIRDEFVHISGQVGVVRDEFSAGQQEQKRDTADHTDQMMKAVAKIGVNTEELENKCEELANRVKVSVSGVEKKTNGIRLAL